MARRSAALFSVLTSSVSLWLLPLVLGGCRIDRGCDPPAAKESADGASSPSAAPVAGVAPPTAKLALRVDDPFSQTQWFANPIGQQAVELLARGEHGAANYRLRELEARRDISPKERAGIDVLLGLDALRNKQDFAGLARLERAMAVRELQAIADDLRTIVAQTYLDRGDTAKALHFASSEPMSPRRSLVLAKLHAAEQDERAAMLALERWDEAELSPALQREFRLVTAQVLAQSTDEVQRSKAHELSTQLAGEGTSRQARAAARLLERMAAPTATDKSNANARNVAAWRALEQAQDLLAARDYLAAVRAVDQLLRKHKKTEAALRCEAYYTKGTAIFKQRRRADSRRPFEEAAKACREGKNVDLAVKSTYQAARGIYAQGDYSAAGHAFEALAKEHPTHSYADDALLNGADAWESAGEVERARALYEHIVTDFAQGDMGEDARRHLLLLDFAQGKLDQAAARLDRALAGTLDGEERAKLIYYRGRVYARQGDVERAKAQWLQVLAVRPLSYPGLLALSRLREYGALDAALARLEQSVGANPAPPHLALPDTPAGQRAWTWAQLGVADRAQQALEEGEIEGWPAAYALARSGDWFASQAKIANLDSSWRAFPPTGAQRPAWELAHPLVFAQQVKGSEQEFQPPPLLTFAVMQTESRFDPSQVSWAGARGLLQLMPSTAQYTAKQLGVDLKKGDLQRPEVNLRLGVSYLAGLVERFGRVSGAEALAVPSYNAGAGNVDKWLAARSSWDLDLFVDAIPFDETRNYTQSVLGRWLAYRWLYSEGPAAVRVPYLPLNAAGACLAARSAIVAARKAPLDPASVDEGGSAASADAGAH